MVASENEIFIESRDKLISAVQPSTPSLNHRRFRSRIPIPDYYCTPPLMVGEYCSLKDRNSDISKDSYSSSEDTCDETDSSGDFFEHNNTDVEDASEFGLDVQQADVHNHSVVIKNEDFLSDDVQIEGNIDGVHVDVQNDAGPVYVQLENIYMGDPEDTFFDVGYDDDAMYDFDNEEEDEPCWYDSGDCEGEER